MSTLSIFPRPSENEQRSKETNPINNCFAIFQVTLSIQETINWNFYLLKELLH